MLITDIIWKERVVEKIAVKHAVSVAEAEEALLSSTVVRRVAKMRGMALPISARDMDRAERKYYGRYR